MKGKINMFYKVVYIPFTGYDKTIIEGTLEECRHEVAIRLMAMKNDTTVRLVKKGYHWTTDDGDMFLVKIGRIL